jgi:ribosome-associated heat shock protein Hsp15
MSTRIDKLVWMLRLAKTRTLAQELIDKGAVKVNEDVVQKSSKTVVPPIQISIRHIPVWRTYQIKDFPKTRIGPKLVEDFMQEITSEDDMKFLEFIQLQNKINRQANPTGRPTKKNRRNIDDFLGN